MTEQKPSEATILKRDIIVVLLTILLLVAAILVMTQVPDKASEWGDLLSGASAVLAALSLVLVAASFRQQQIQIAQQRADLAENLAELQEARRLAEARRMEDSFLALSTTMTRIAEETTFQKGDLVLRGNEAFRAYHKSFTDFLESMKPKYEADLANGFAHWFRKHGESNESIEPFMRATLATLRHVDSMTTRTCKVKDKDHPLFDGAEIALWKDLLTGSLSKEQIQLLLTYGASRFGSSEGKDEAVVLLRSTRMVERLRGPDRAFLGNLANRYS